MPQFQSIPCQMHKRSRNSKHAKAAARLCQDITHIPGFSILRHDIISLVRELKTTSSHIFSSAHLLSQCNHILRQRDIGWWIPGIEQVYQGSSLGVERDLIIKVPHEIVGVAQLHYCRRPKGKIALNFPEQPLDPIAAAGQDRRLICRPRFESATGEPC